MSVECGLVIVAIYYLDTGEKLMDFSVDAQCSRPITIVVVIIIVSWHNVVDADGHQLFFMYGTERVFH